VINFKFEVLWIVVLCCVRIPTFQKSIFLKMEAACVSEILVSCNTTWCHNPEDLN